MLQKKRRLFTCKLVAAVTRNRHLIYHSKVELSKSVVKRRRKSTPIHLLDRSLSIHLI